MRPSCDSDHDWEVTTQASFVTERLVWSQSSICRACQARMEVDGDGIPPLEVRELLLSRDGVWGLRNASRRGFAQAVASLLHRGIVEVWPLVAVRDGVIAVGTKAEALWVAVTLRTSGEETELVPVDGTDGIVAILSRRA